MNENNDGKSSQLNCWSYLLILVGQICLGLLWWSIMHILLPLKSGNMVCFKGIYQETLFRLEKNNFLASLPKFLTYILQFFIWKSKNSLHILKFTSMPKFPVTCQHFQTRSFPICPLFPDYILYFINTWSVFMFSNPFYYNTNGTEFNFLWVIIPYVLFTPRTQGNC